jgi:hypothetical protein
MHGMRAADRYGSGLGQADVANLTLGDQFGQGTHCLLDGCLGIDAVLVVQIDVVSAQPPQRALDCGANVCFIR